MQIFFYWLVLMPNERREGRKQEPGIIVWGDIRNEGLSPLAMHAQICYSFHGFEFLVETVASRLETRKILEAS